MTQGCTLPGHIERWPSVGPETGRRGLPLSCADRELGGVRETALFFPTSTTYGASGGATIRLPTSTTAAPASVSGSCFSFNTFLDSLRVGCLRILDRRRFPLAEPAPHLLEPLAVLRVSCSLLGLVQKPPPLRALRETDQPSQHSHLILLSWKREVPGHVDTDTSFDVPPQGSIHTFRGSRRSTRSAAESAVQFFIPAPYVRIEAVRALVTGHEAETSWLGVALTIASAALMPPSGSQSGASAQSSARPRRRPKGNPFAVG